MPFAVVTGKTADDYSVILNMLRFCGTKQQVTERIRWFIWLSRPAQNINTDNMSKGWAAFTKEAMPLLQHGFRWENWP